MNEQLSKIFNESTKVPIVVGVASFVAGVGVGFGVNYILNRKNSPEEIVPHKIPDSKNWTEGELDKFIASEKKRLGLNTILPEATEKEPEVKEPELDVQASIVADTSQMEKQIEETIELLPEPEEPEDDTAVKNVFAGSDDEWDYDHEIKSRSSSEPYVLHKDEFYADELNYSQITLTYYAGDDILVDDEDTPIYNYNVTVGPMKFGHGSGDPNVFYVRNDKRKAEYEILRDQGHYSVEILGLDMQREEGTRDLRHSRGVPRFHMD